MPKRNTYTTASGNYTGAAGVANARVRIASWQIQHPKGVAIGPQRPGAKDLVVFIQSVAPAHIATGTIEIVIEDSNRQRNVPAFVVDAATVPTTLAIAYNQDTALTYHRNVKGSFGDYISVYFTSATASVAANCTYKIPVMEL